MAGPVSGVAGKRLEVEPAVSAAHKLRSPGFQIVHDVDDVVHPHARELGIDQLPAVFEDILKMKLRTVVIAHGGREAASRHRGRAAGGAALGHLDDGDARVSAFERSHGTGGTAADDQHVGLVPLNGNIKAKGHGSGLAQVLAIATNASTQASAKTGSLTCSACSSIGATFKCVFRESMKS